ncbi:hypothetical protein HRG_005744 [Hirsutella rhossiliensis]|uniref:Uncharacterized protein n=1 Tax=Hirsutella rhossiliensis TaxID=111463 RepID=A0A9P8MXY1_9HYPO|nr:uncharacterized protein HRG_05744 [Hirsutella rhossiliensis]KAH0963234.1 hypothetical protein HRG_05744 [Hirsutella rhossiliensis]
MASRKPDFRLSIPAREQPDADTHRPSVSSPRSPRFHEDFDAPFSEAIMNASRTTLATDFSDSYPSSNSRHSHDADHKRQGPATNSTPPKARLQSPSPHQLRRDTLPPSEPAKASSVNDRIRDWARKSFPFTRKGPEQPDETDSPRHQRRQSKAPSTRPASASQKADAGTAPSPD